MLSCISAVICVTWAGWGIRGTQSSIASNIAKCVAGHVIAAGPFLAEGDADNFLEELK